MRIEEEIGPLLRKAGLTIAVAESCTGGMLGQRISSVGGSSDYFLGGVIAYANDVKVRLLGVDVDVLAREGAVSAAVAEEMATGVRAALGSGIALSVTGIAGPTGGSREKPVGLVFIGMAEDAGCRSEKFQFTGDREAVRQRTADEALQWLRKALLERK